MRPFYLYIILTICALAFPNDLQAQKIYEEIHIDLDQGLQSRTIDHVIRNEDGFFYLFNRNGIQRYDGRNFEDVDISIFSKMKMKVGDITQVLKIGPSIIMTIADGENIFTIDNNQLGVKTSSSKGVVLQDGKSLKAVIKKADGKNHSLFEVDLRDQFSLESPIYIDFPKNIIQSKTLDNRHYIVDNDQKIYQLKDDSFIDLGEVGRLGVTNNSVYIFGKNTIKKIVSEGVELIYSFNNSSAVPDIIKNDDNGNLAVSYKRSSRFQDYLFVIDTLGKVHNFENIINVSNKFKDFHSDDFFYRWMLAGYNGVHVVNIIRSGSEFILNNPNIPKGEFGNVISGIASNGDEVLFTKESEKLYKYEPKTGEVNEVIFNSTSKDIFTNNSKMFYNSASDLYYSYCYSAGDKSYVNVFNPRSKYYKRFLIPFKVKDVLWDKEDELFIVGHKNDEGLIYTLKMSDGSLVERKKISYPIQSIEYLPKLKSYWVGSYQGLFVLDDQLNEMVRFGSDQVPERYILYDRIADITLYEDKVLVGSVGGGLYVVDPKENKILKSFDSKTRLTDDYVIGFQKDLNGLMWISTFNGLNVIDKSFEIIRQFYEFEGLVNREFNSESVTIDKNGQIYFGTLNGVSKIDPAKLLQWENSEGFAIEEILEYGNDGVKAYSEFEDLALYNSVDSFRVNVRNPDYHHYPYSQILTSVQTRNNAKIYLKEHSFLKLDAFDQEDAMLDLTNTRSRKTKELSFTIKKDYRTISMIFGILAATVFFSWLIIKAITTYNLKQEEAKTKLHKRISELQITSLQSQMNPHFIFNALGSIQYFIQTHDTEKADEYLSNFALLMRKILESSKSKFIRLSEEVELLKLYIGLEKVRFEQLFDYQIDVDPNLDMEINVPPMIIQPFVENAINHGLHNLKGRKGKLRLAYEEVNENHLRVLIVDNGVGRKAAAALRMKKHKSRGMQIVEERLSTFNDAQDLKVSIEVEDLKENQIDIGTKVIINIIANFD